MSKRKEREERRREALRKKHRQEKRQSTKSFQEQQEVSQLIEIIASGAPAPGVNPLSVEQAVAGSYAGARAFEELPLSRYTQEALKQAGYVSLTAIQRAALPHALAGRDILGAAKTGSGKTLCFLIPVSDLLPSTFYQVLLLHSCITIVVCQMAATILIALRSTRGSAGNAAVAAPLRQAAECSSCNGHHLRVHASNSQCLVLAPVVSFTAAG